MQKDKHEFKIKDRIIEPTETQYDLENKETYFSLRPKKLDDYIGQEQVKENLKIFIDAAKRRGDGLDHCLFYGPPGIGKTTLAEIVANEMGVNFKITSGPAIERPGDLASILTNLSKNDVLFIDEIHRISRNIEEVLYPAMEDFGLDIIIGKGPSARSIRLDLPKFTLIGATTRAGQLSTPLRDRFGIVLKLELYSTQSLAQIVKRSSKILGIDCDEEGTIEIAARSRGIPRIANRLLKRVRDFAQYDNCEIINRFVADKALKKLNIDKLGLDSNDYKILKFIVKNYAGGPVGIKTLAAAIGEETVTIEDVYEPYLIQIGFLTKTPRGRCVTDLCYKYLGVEREIKH